LTVFDFGGGTLDIAIVRNDRLDDAGRARFTVVGSGGVAELGGLDLDAALVDHLGQVLGTAVPQAWERLARPGTPAQWRDRRQFWDDVRGAKEMLSRSATAPVPVPGVDQAVHLTRDELERAAGPLVHRGIVEAARVLAASGVPADRMAGLFLVGGSSRVPLVARLLHAELRLAPTVLEQPELPVAEGALTEVAPAQVTVPAAVPGTAPVAASPAGPPAAGSFGPPAVAPPGPPAAGSFGPPAVAPSGPPAAGSFGPPAAAPAGPGVPPYPVTTGPRRPARRRAVIWIAAGLALALLVAVGGVTFYRWYTSPHELEFVDVRQVEGIGVGPDRPSYAYTSVVGDRAYLAWQDDESDRLEVIAVDAGTGAERWRHRFGPAEQWAGIRAYAHLVLVTAYVPSTAAVRPMYALDPATGRELWRRDIHGDDRVWVYDKIVVLADNERDRLSGLNPRTGDQEWTRANPRSEFGYQDAAVYAALTEDDVSGPAGADGTPLATVVDDDYRLVQIGSDRWARVIDARTGGVLSERGNVGDPTGNYLAYGGRLFAAGTGGGYQIVAYELAELGEPRSVYRAADADRSLGQLAPCGEDRVCVLDSRSGSETVELAAVQVDGGQLWRRPARDADSILPVGDRVLVATDSPDARWTLRDSDGGELLSRDGTAVRVDDGNLLSFAGTFSTSSTDLSLAGVGALSGSATELGPLPQTRGETCSWNRSVIACMADEQFVLWRYAED
jgi:outer membrane protein assembly factor BamB